jgi:predicted RND superfamily exporter protein
MTATTSLSGFFEVLQMSDRVQSIVAHDLPNNLKVEVSGFMPVIARSVETIVDSQFSGLLFCFTVVLGIVMLALRSFRLGLISLFPNLFPLLVLAGLLAFSFPAIDSDFIIIFTIAFGIAVDDTIHFLHRYDVEFTNCRSRRQAVVSAFSYSGHAIVQTTVVLGLGLLPLAMSNYLTIQMLGTYLVLTLVLALLADLLLLPALVLLLGGASEYEKTIPEETH